jgi:cob(I)alamin adenosyltransferase
MKIYTKTGDSGETGLFAGPRVWKDDTRIEAFGAVDELNAALGWARNEVEIPQINQLLMRSQHDLFAMGAELATPDPQKHRTNMLTNRSIESLEQAIDQYEATLPALQQFVLPGGSRPAAALHLARGICRRAERRTVSLYRALGVSTSSIPVIYLNRLGDLLFVLARAANKHSGVPDVPWVKPSLSD